MTNHLHNNCESIDAAVFSGDTLHDPERIAELKAYVGRWVREINLHERLCAPDLQALHDRLLAPRAIVRDDDGMLDHPDLPVVDESVDMRMFLAAFGLECGTTKMEGDLDDEAMLNYEGDCSGWTPSKPAGDGWNLVSIHDTEDGPAALYLRSAATAPRDTVLRHSSKDGRLLRAHEPDDGDPDASEVESVIACLGDDAAALREENPESEVAANMVRASELLEALLPQSEWKSFSRVDALTKKWDDDGATRGAAYIELRDLARMLEREQGGEAVRLLRVLHWHVERQPDMVEKTAVLSLVELANEEARGLAAGPFMQVVKEHAEAFVRILGLLGMEEEGDAVAEVNRLLNLADKHFNGEVPQ